MPDYTGLMDSAIEQDGPMERAIEGDLYAMPATQGQVRFWSLDQLNPGNPALNMPLMWKFSGVLDLAMLTEAFGECVARHETLRTTFELVGRELSQVIHAPMRAAIPVVDLSAVPVEEQPAEADRLAREHAAIRMNLRTGPLLNLKLLRFNERSHLLLVTMHHIICDGISNGILLRDMMAFYRSLSLGQTPHLPELPIQFADFAVWQKSWLAGSEPAESMKFWQESLGNDFGRINLPHDHDAAAAIPERLEAWTGNIETLLIPKALQMRAQAYCVREHVTLNILLFSVFAALLQRLTGQHDLAIGSPCANRTEDTADLIGLFMNIQVMRLRLHADTSFKQLLRMVQDWTLGAYENQELPFEDLVHDPFFASGGSPFEIPVFFLYQKSFMLTHTVGELEVVPLRSESPGAVFEMMFAIVDREEEGPRLQLEYDPRVFKVSTIERTLRTFVTLLESALDAPETRIEDLAVLEAQERQQEIDRWNQTAVDFGPYEAVSETFLRRARAEPESVALECDGVEWSAARLARFSLSLAQRLTAEGLQRGDRVGIAVKRSPEMVGALLAVMIAGGVYVPLDPRHPRERLQRVLADAGASLLLSCSDLELETLARVVRVDDPAQLDASRTQPPAADAGELAYVIFTSGSTGMPKGVAIEHGSLFNLLRSMQREPGLGPEDVFVSVTTLAFDIAGLELLLPLLTGARLIIATDEEVVDARLLLQRMRTAGATVLQATPGAWRLLLDAGWAKDERLKALCGGETLPRELAERMLSRAGEVWNMYGPTETTVWSSATRVHHGKDTLRLGVPIANTQFYVLGSRRQLVPRGVTGELYIGGSGVARGYWDREDLTAAQFHLNPFHPGRMYATGDLARQRDDGTIELLGRADHQVKIRGYRIELAEIEGGLLQHSRVKEAVVVQRQSQTTGVTQLAAYVATEIDGPVERDVLQLELKRTLERTLPDYMMPNVFVFLSELPRNTNGKIDRRALPHASGDDGPHASLTEDDHYYPPTDAIERQLADIWQTTLGIPRVSVRASFFSLGVGSLAALRLITRMNRIFGTDLGLASLISASTIQSIAALIESRFAPNMDSSLVPLQPEGANPPLFIVHGVGGNIVNFYGLAMRMGKDQPVYGIQSQALLNNQPGLLRLADMAAVYVADLRTRQPHGPYHLLGYSFGGTVALEMAHQLRAAGEEVALLGMIDSKSKDYEERLAQLKGMQERIGSRVTRFKGNTIALSWGERFKYVRDKLETRAIRFACMTAARLHMRQVPAFMRSAYDINYVAIQNYKLKKYDGKLVLFRASYQDDARGPYDLGWSSIFTEPLEIHELPGDHERIFLEPNIDSLASSLRDALVTV